MKTHTNNLSQNIILLAILITAFFCISTNVLAVNQSDTLQRMKTVHVLYIDGHQETYLPNDPDYKYWDEARQGDATDELLEEYMPEAGKYFDIDWFGFHPTGSKDAIKEGLKHAVEDFSFDNTSNHAKVKFFASTSLGSSVLAITAVDWIIANPGGAGLTWHPAFLLENLPGGTNSNGSDYDWETTWNRTLSNWSYLIDGTYVPGTYNLMYVIMHEICTGMGFSSSAQYDGIDYTFGWSAAPNIFDRYIIDQNGVLVWGNPNYSSSSELQALFTSDQVYFLVNYENYWARLYAPDPWYDGSSISRLREASYWGLNECMTAHYSVSDTIHLDIGWVAKRMLETIGWVLETPLTDPVASFTADQTVIYAGESITFTNTSSNGIESEWWFESGTPDTVHTYMDSVVVVYNTVGNYDVTLIVHNYDGVDTLVMTDYITVNQYPAPIADFHASDTCILEGGSVDFFDDSQNSPTSWSWSFPGGNPNSSTQQNPTGIQYNTAGYYDVTLTATNAGGNNTLTKADYIFVDSLPVLAVNPHEINLGSEQSGTTFSESFDITNDGGDTLAGTVTENATFITSLSPDNFSLTTGESVTVNFSGEFPIAVGTFETYIQIVSNAGNDSVHVYGETLQPPTLCLSPLNVDLGAHPIGHAFSEDLTVENCGQGTLIGTMSSLSIIPTINPTGFNLPGGGQTIINVSGIFQNQFGYFEFYVVANSNGGDDSTHFYGTVDSLLADFTASSTMIQVGSSVNFTDQSTGNPTIWNWWFEGGTPETSTAQNPSGIVYNTVGNFDVQLIVEDGYGNVDTLLRENYITVTATPPPPVPNFISDKDTVDASGTVYFTDLSTGDPDTWEWIFEAGNPGTSSSQTPPGIVYETVGTFDVTLTVGNANGDSTLVKENYITVIPVANAGENDSVTEGDVYTLNGVNSFPQPLGYAWTSLDGIILDDPASATPSFTAPMVGGDTDVYFTLTVNRDEQFSRPDTVIIKILDYVGISDSYPSGYESFKIKIYPNPFKEKLTISFSLTKSEKIVLSIFDIQGRLVETLANQTLPAGDHLFSFKKENSTSGMYIISLYKSGEFYRNKIWNIEYYLNNSRVIIKR